MDNVGLIMGGSGGGGGNTEARLEHDFLPELLGKLRRHTWFIISFTILLFGLAMFCIQMLPKTYEGVASVQVLSQTAKVANRDMVTGDQTFTDETAGTELGTLRSRELITAVIKRLNLLNVPEFNPNLKPDFMARTLAWARNTPLTLIPEHWLTTVIGLLPQAWVEDEPEISPPTQADKAMFDTIARFKELVKAAPVSHSKIIEVTASSHDRVLAAQIANAVVDEYIATHKRAKDELLTEAHAFTGSQVPQLRQAMLDKIAAVDRFRAEHDLVSGQTGPNWRERLTEATKSLADAKATQSRLEASVAAVQGRDVDPLTVPEVLASQTIQNLRQEEAKAAEEVGFGNTYQRDRLSLKQVAVEGRINAEAKRIVASLPKLLEAAKANVRAQTTYVASLGRQVAGMEQQQSQLNTLQADAELARAQWEKFYKDSMDTQPALDSSSINVRWVSQAGTPFKPAFPNMTIAMPCALFLSLLTTSTIALYWERHGTGLRSSLTIGNLFNVDVIGKIPLRSKSSHDEMYATAIEELCTSVFPPWQADLKKTLLITSPMPHDGKTTIAKALGEAAASRGIKVVILDADMRVSQGREIASPVPGLGDVLTNHSTVDDIQIKSTSGLVYIPAGTARANPTRLLALPSLPILIRQLQQDYDLVIIDTPPASVGGDVLTLSHHATEVLVVISYGETLGPHLRLALDKIQPTVMKNRPPVYIALNKMPIGGSGVEEIAHSSRMMRYYQSHQTRMIK